MESTNIIRAARELIAPASFAQESIWPYCRSPEGMAAYFKSEVNRISGKLDIDLLGKSISYIIARHDVFRTRIAELDGTVVQIIQPFVGFTLPTYDLAPGADAESRAIDISRNMIAVEGVHQRPLFGFALLHVSVEEHWLIYACHQLLWDQWSSRIFLLELANIYASFKNDTQVALPEYEPVQYADFAAWQKDRLAPQSEFYREALSWWAQHFRTAGPNASLSFARPKPASGVNSNEGKIEWSPDKETRAAVISLRRSASTSLFVIWLSALSAILTDKAKSDGLTIGVYMSCRSLDVAANQMIGAFINLVAFYISCDRSLTLIDWARTVHQIVAEGQKRSDIPHDRLRSELEKSGVAVPEVKLIFGAPMNLEGDIEIAGLTFSRQVIALQEDVGMPWGISVSVHTSPDDSLCWFDANLYEPQKVDRLIEKLKRLLRLAGSRPDESLAVLVSELGPI